MKFNLKNRSKLGLLPYPTQIDEINKWFEGFEKELRKTTSGEEGDVCSDCHVSGPRCDFGGGGCEAFKKLKEILGE